MLNGFVKYSAKVIIKRSIELSLISSFIINSDRLVERYSCRWKNQDEKIY
jgi:hypothetical protein